MITKSHETQRLAADVLVIGGGIAGCHAALRAHELGCKVVLVEKANVGRGGYSHQMSGILSYFEPTQDDADAWYEECVQAGQGMVDQDRLAGMVEETTERIRDLANWGVQFQTRHSEFIRNPGVGHKRGRNVLLANGGFQMMSTIRGEVLRRGIDCVERVHITDLFTSDAANPTGGRVTGAIGFHVRRGRVYVIQTKAVVMATGATDVWYLKAPSLSGDGRVMAHRLGCEMRNVELAFGTPKPTHFDTAPGSNELFGEGSYILNAKGERFMEAWDAERIERAPRAVMVRAINEEYVNGRGPVCLDARHLSEEAHGRLEKTLPILVNSFAKAGKSLRHDKIEYTAVMTDLGPGGLRVNTNGATNVGGLFAAGAVTDHGEDGVSNILSHGILSALGGWRAGATAAGYAAGCDHEELSSENEQAFRASFLAPLDRPDKASTTDVLKLYQQLHDLIGLRRNPTSIAKALRLVDQARGELFPNLKARDYHHLSVVLGQANALLFVEMLAKTALRREESRGAHFREDFPKRDDANWLKWLTVKPGSPSSNDLLISDEPVPAGRSTSAAV